MDSSRNTFSYLTSSKGVPLRPAVLASSRLFFQSPTSTPPTILVGGNRIIADTRMNSTTVQVLLCPRSSSVKSIWAVPYFSGRTWPGSPCRTLSLDDLTQSVSAQYCFAAFLSSSGAMTSSMNACCLSPIASTTVRKLRLSLTSLNFICVLVR